MCLPFLCGEEISMGDIFIAPFFDRMAVLEHYRGFHFPESSIYKSWHTWGKNLLSHPIISETRQPKEKLLEYYKMYANGKIRNKDYEKYYMSEKAKKRDRLIYKYYWMSLLGVDMLFIVK